jgi:hypothetical protein
MHKRLVVITLLACSFLLPSWALADLKGSFACCATTGPYSGTGSDHGSASDFAPAEANHSGSGQIVGTHHSGSGHHAQASRDSGAPSTSLTDLQASHHGADHASAYPADDPAEGQGQDHASGDAQASHPSCNALSCAQAPAASVPEAFPQLSRNLVSASYASFTSHLPAPPAQILFRPPRA